MPKAEKGEYNVLNVEYGPCLMISYKNKIDRYKIDDVK